MTRSDRQHVVVNLTTGQTRPAYPEPPLSSSASGPWRGFLIEHHRAGRVFDFQDVAVPDHVVVIQIAGDSNIEWREGGRYREIVLGPGRSIIIPAMHPFSTRSRQSGEVVVVSLETRFLRLAAHDLFGDAERIDLRPMAPLEDPLITALGRTLLNEIKSDYPGGRVYGECLSTALAAHLVRHYAGVTPSSEPPASGLARNQLRRVIDFMDANLGSDLSLVTLARQAGLSPFHFSRRFKESTGLSPHQYLIRRRVERARQLLLGRHGTTSEIARQVGFCDQSHLTSHFRRAYGVTPLEFRRRIAPDFTDAPITPSPSPRPRA